MTETEEHEFINSAYRLLRSEGTLMIECRSINDPLALVGEAISPTERIHGHYRRFIVMADLLQTITDAGFHIKSAVESKGLAVFGNEDPVVIRVIALKS
jgi:hypothetical protein